MSGEATDLENIDTATGLVEHSHPGVTGHHLATSCQENVLATVLGQLFPQESRVPRVTDHTGEKSRIS